MGAYRNFDNRDAYFDKDEKPLHGKLIFYYRHTTSLAPIYSYHLKHHIYYEIANPVFTDAHGQTETQVFLKGETDYTVYYYKYIGNGMMSTDNDPTHWELQYTADNLNPTTPSSLEDLNAEMSVPNLVALRNVSSSLLTDGTTALLNGYFEAGDKPIVAYVWNPNSTVSDNGGSVIKANDASVGRWEMVLQSDYLDVRHFGVFGGADYYQSNELASQFGAATGFANFNGVDLFIPNGYYMFIGGNFQVVSKIRVADRTVLMAKAGTTTTLKCESIVGTQSQLFRNDPDSIESANYGHLNITCDEAYSGWIGNANAITFTAKVYHINSTNNFYSINDAKVIFEVSFPYTIRLTNCVIESAGNIAGPIYVTKTHIDSTMLADNYSVSDIYPSQCTTALRDWKTADDYIKIKNKLNQNDYGDLGEQTITNANFLAGALVENCYGSGSFNGDCELHNCNLVMTVNNTPFVNAVDCTLNFSANSTISSLNLLGSSLTSSTKITIVGYTNIDDSVVNCELDVRSTIHATDSTLSTVDCIEPHIFRCNLNGNVNHTWGSSPINFELVGNYFNGTYHNMTRHPSSSTTAALVNGTWANNFASTATHFIAMDRTYLHNTEILHQYKYYGNSGPNVLQKSASAQFYKRLYWETDSDLPADDYLVYIIEAGDDNGLRIYSHGHPFTMSFFSVGTSSISKKLTISMQDWYTPGLGSTAYTDSYRPPDETPNCQLPTQTRRVSTTAYRYSSSDETKVFANLEFQSGYQWKVSTGRQFTAGYMIYRIKYDEAGDFGHWWTTRPHTMYVEVSLE